MNDFDKLKEQYKELSKEYKQLSRDYVLLCKAVVLKDKQIKILTSKELTNKQKKSLLVVDETVIGG